MSCPSQNHLWLTELCKHISFCKRVRTFPDHLLQVIKGAQEAFQVPIVCWIVKIFCVFIWHVMVISWKRKWYFYQTNQCCSPQERTLPALPWSLALPLGDGGGLLCRASQIFQQSFLEITYYSILYFFQSFIIKSVSAGQIIYVPPAAKRCCYTS